VQHHCSTARSLSQDLAERLAWKQTLIVLDDACSADVVRAVNTLGAHVLVATVHSGLAKRLRTSVAASSVKVYNMRVLAPAAARVLLHSQFNFSVRSRGLQTARAAPAGRRAARTCWCIEALTAPACVGLL
jgi:hypothetical protein